MSNFMDGKTILTLIILIKVASADEIVHLKQGSLKGLASKTIYHNITFLSFKGIPYAAPRTGHERFLESEPAEPWQGVYDATHHRENCMQYLPLSHKMRGHEDCLHVNVYTPNLNVSDRTVMVWIHGYNFHSLGSGDDKYYGPDYFIELDMVVVTFNYRLGPLGFLSTQDKFMSGNFGMKDQVLALEWVRDNIGQFSGSPSKVVIFGSNFGGTSVQYHMLSPMSRGLFKAAIQQSGSIGSPWAYSEEPKTHAFELGKVLGIDANNSEELIKQLLEIPSEQIFMAASEIQRLKNQINGDFYMFAPTVEEDYGQKIFLPENPWKTIVSGNIYDVPMMVGMNSNEGSMFTNDIDFDILSDNLEQFLPKYITFENQEDKDALLSSLKGYYLSDKLSEESPRKFDMLVTDLIATHSFTLTSKILYSRKKEDIYQYLFTFDFNEGFWKDFNVFRQNAGPTVGDELFYEFYSNYLKNLPLPDTDLDTVLRLLTKLWCNFANQGTPTSIVNNEITTQWEPMGPKNNYIIIDTKLKMESNLFGDRFNVWSKSYNGVLGSNVSLVVSAK